MTTILETYRSFKRTHGAAAAREAMLATLRQDRSVAETARQWGCSRNTVALAQAKQTIGTLADGDRTPRHQPRLTAATTTAHVTALRRETGYGKVRLARELVTRYQEVMPESTIGKIITREKIPGKTYRSAWRRKTRRYYDRSTLVPFERNEIDTKDIADKTSIPQALYDRIDQGLMPRWQWTWIDVASRTRFLAYSYEHTWANGQIFFQLVRAWLDLFGVTETIGCSIDGGVEWHATTERSFDGAMDRFYRPLRCQMSIIRKRHPEDNCFVERSHRTDDEECYVPLTPMLVDEVSFRQATTWWPRFYNTERKHQGLAGQTPLTVLQQKRPGIHPAIAHFPPIILDRQFSTFSSFLPAQNVFDYYLFAGPQRCQAHDCSCSGSCLTP